MELLGNVARHALMVRYIIQHHFFQEMWAAFEVVIDRVQQTAAEEKAKSNQ